jgi:dihydroorotate dehydrogenase
MPFFAKISPLLFLLSKKSRANKNVKMPIQTNPCQKPIFIKMPINETNKDVLEMLQVISKHKIAGVIFGNLQKDRKDKALVQSEVAKFPVGNFSGRPTYARSNELIELTYRNFKDRFVIIGTGGVFSAKDAYRKIVLGASLVQLITGLVFEGPQVVSQINQELISLLKKDGFTNIRQATGSAVKNS